MRLPVTIFHETRHLDEDALEPDTGRCPVCEAPDPDPVMILQKEPRVVLRSCRSCHAASASRLPTSRALDAYYADYYPHEPSPNAAARVTVESDSGFGAHLARRMLRHGAPRPTRLLDFGGGDGSIVIRAAELLTRQGFPPPTVTVVDYSEGTSTPRDPGIRTEKRRTLEDVGAGEFDLVCASGIIEHLPRPRAPLEELLRRVAPGGLFYARTPYMLPLVQLLERLGQSWDFTFPGHIHDLGPDFWNTFLARSDAASGLTLVESRPSRVETRFRGHPLRTLASHVLKAPWHVLGDRYRLVGGWEVFGLRASDG